MLLNHALNLAILERQYKFNLRWILAPHEVGEDGCMSYFCLPQFCLLQVDRNYYLFTKIEARKVKIVKRRFLFLSMKDISIAFVRKTKFRRKLIWVCIDIAPFSSVRIIKLKIKIKKSWTLTDLTVFGDMMMPPDLAFLLHEWNNM